MIRLICGTVNVRDGPRVDEVNDILTDLWSRQRLAAVSALGGSALAVLVGIFAVRRSRRRNTRIQEPIRLQEETASWLLSAIS